MSWQIPISVNRSAISVGKPVSGDPVTNTPSWASIANLEAPERRFSDPRRTDYQDVATLQINYPELFKSRISAAKRKSHIDHTERALHLRNLSIFPYVGSRPI